jgi:hypothetical protein
MPGEGDSDRTVARAGCPAMWKRCCGVVVAAASDMYGSVATPSANG